MTDPIRDLLISLSSHMAYMQGQLEARGRLGETEDYCWCRESVLLRQKVMDALADEPAVPEGREPAAVAERPSDEELRDLWSWAAGQDQGPWPTQYHCFARAVLARWGNPAPQPVPVSERLTGQEVEG